MAASTRLDLTAVLGRERDALANSVTQNYRNRRRMLSAGTSADDRLQA
jgi:hypothetical protein